MLKFYRNTGLIVVALVAVSYLSFVIATSLSKQEVPLLPGKDSDVYWYPSKMPKDTSEASHLTVKNNGLKSGEVQYSFILDEEEVNPYTSFIFYLAKPSKPEDLVDLNDYSGINLTASCTPQNMLVFALYTYSDSVTQLDRPETYRVHITFFQCSSTAEEISIPFSELEGTDWWIERYGLKYTDRKADLSRAHGFSINNSLQSPRKVQSDVTLHSVALVKTDNRYLYVCSALVLIAWLGLGVQLVKYYIRERIQAAKSKLEAERPLVAYQKIDIQQQSSDLKTKLLQHIAVHYNDPELNPEGVAKSLGTNRSKLNEILKEELQLTFTAYVNKLRLTEALRLLNENPKLSIMQIALEVGYKNVSYFNMLFKKEYGCTPKMIKNKNQPPAEE